MEDDQWFCEDCQEIHFLGQTCGNNSPQEPDQIDMMGAEELREELRKVLIELEKNTVRNVASKTPAYAILDTDGGRLKTPKLLERHIYPDLVTAKQNRSYQNMDKGYYPIAEVIILVADLE